MLMALVSLLYCVLENWGPKKCVFNPYRTKKEGEHLIPRSAWGLSSPGKQVGRSSTPCRKGAKFGVEKVNVGQNICNRDASVGNGKSFEKQAQSSKQYTEVHRN